MITLKPSTEPTTPENHLMQKDKWHAEDIGKRPEYSHGDYSLNFTKIQLPWLKECTKKFILFQSSTKSFASCISYIRALNYFSEFLLKQVDHHNPKIVDRKLVVKYIHFLNMKKLSQTSRTIALIHLRTFHTICVQEEWLAWPEKPIVFPNDLSKWNCVEPRYIPDIVIEQLKKHLHHMVPLSKQRFITILLETGRRISEICTLPYQCLERDAHADWYLKVHEKKMNKTRIIPISAACLNAIQTQQQEVYESTTDSIYLFPSTKRGITSRSPHVGARYINVLLKRFAIKHNIVDDNGKIWNFQCHQFRHTVGTNMINSGVPQVIVQKYLGHESSRMTERYAHIHDETLKKAFIDYQNSLVNIHGDKTMLEAQWLKENIASQALPNGLCALPLTQKRCPHANACLTCANFRTNKKYLPQHKAQLEQTVALISTAQNNGWQRIIEMNTDVANNLTTIIHTLESA